MPVDTSMAGNRIVGALSDPANAIRSAVTHSQTMSQLSLSAEERRHNETVEGKWEQLQQYEARWQHQQQQEGFNSMGTTASTTSSASSTSSAGSVDPGHHQNASKPKHQSKFQQMKRNSIKKLSSLKTQLTGLTRSGRHRGHADYGAVSTAPDGAGGPDHGVIPRIRASKSMQNLEQITRDGYYNLREMKTSLKEKYNSRQELRQGRPTSYYAEFWDEYDPDVVKDPDMDEESFNNVTKYHQKNRVLEFIGLH